MWALLMIGVAAMVLLVRQRRSGLPMVEFFGILAFHAYSRLWHGVVVAAPPRLAEEKSAILVVNHSSSPDGAFISCVFPRPISYLVAREYFELPVFGPMFRRMGCVPVRRDGRDPTAVRLGLRRLSEGRILCIFPEGGLSNAGHDKRRRVKAGVALLALRSRAPVYPVRVTGGPQTANIPRAWLSPSRARVTVGPAVDLAHYYGRRIDRKLLDEVASLLMERVAQILPPNQRRPRRFP